jgi:transketolase
MREGRDLLLVTTGITLKHALEAATRLAGEGLEAAVLHVPTVKPLDRAAILERAAQVPAVLTIEEHSVVGGLGSAVAELIAEAGFERGKRFRRLGIPDVFPDDYGSQASLMERFGIGTGQLVAAARELLGRAS